jgi:hypothetical protein
MVRYLAARLAVTATIFAIAPATAQTAHPADATAALRPSAAADPFEQAMAARATADFARRNHDPMAMLTAARMLGEVPVSGDQGDAGFTPKALYAEARTLADGNDLLLQQITVAESNSARGVLSSAFGSGLVRRVLMVSPRAAYQFVVNAKGGERLRLGAIGAPGTALLMRMLDQFGKTVCLDDHGDYAPVCQLTPTVDARFRVDIQNKSEQSSQTVVLSN